MILFNGMKMMRLPYDYIDKVVEYVRTEHVKVQKIERFKNMESRKVYTE